MDSEPSWFSVGLTAFCKALPLRVLSAGFSGTCRGGAPPRTRLALPDLMPPRGIPSFGGVGSPDEREPGTGVRVWLTCLRIPASLWISLIEMHQGRLSVAFRVTWGLHSFTRPFPGFSASPFIPGAPAGLVFPLVCFEVGDFSACLAVCAG